MIYTSFYQSPVGKLLIAEKNNSIVGLWIESQKYYCPLKDETVQDDTNKLLIFTKKWLDAYFAKKKPSIKDVSLAPKGSDFAQSVWQLLCKIPYGKTITYGDIAKEIAQQKNIKSMSAQAVGGAVGHNPISIIIPCHRVIGKNDNLTGYAGGINKKLFLLKHEGIL